MCVRDCVCVCVCVVLCVCCVSVYVCVRDGGGALRSEFYSRRVIAELLFGDISALTLFRRVPHIATLIDRLDLHARFVYGRCAFSVVLAWGAAGRDFSLFRVRTQRLPASCH